MLTVGQSRNIPSSEDLSVCSNECEKPVNVHSTRKSDFHGSVEKKRLPDVYSKRLKNLETVKGSQNKSKCSEINQSQIQFKEAQNKVNNSKYEKNTVNISAQKLSLTYKEGMQTRFSSVNSALYKNTCNPKKGSCQLFNKNKENNANDFLSLTGTNDTKSSSSRKGRKIIEIEVFMPIIDVEKNIIIYPKSNKPTVKRHFIEEKNTSKTKENKKQSTVSSKKHDERSNKTVQSNLNNSQEIPKDMHGIRETLQTNLMKNTNEALNNSVPGINKASQLNLKKSPKEILNKSISRMNKTLQFNLKDTLQKTPLILSNLNLKSISKPTKTFSFRNMVENNSLKSKSLAKNSLNLGMEKNIYAFQNLLRDIASDTGNMSTSTTDAIEKYKSIHTCSSSKPICSEITLEAKTGCNLRHENINNLIHGNIWKTPAEKVHNSAVKAKKASSCLMYEKKTDNNFGKINKEKSQDGTIVELVEIEFPGDGKLKRAGKLKQLSLVETAARKKDSESSFRKTLMRKSHESGWRRHVPVHSEIGNLTKSKWRPVPENDGLSLSSWIERCRYLQSKDVCSHSHRKSSWHPD